MNPHVFERYWINESTHVGTHDEHTYM